MERRYVAAVAVFILTFILHVNLESRDGLHVSLGAHAEAKFAPDAAPATLMESQSERLPPLDDLDLHEHDDHEIVVNEIASLEQDEIAPFDLLTPEFHLLSIYYPLKRPPRS